MFWSNGRRSRTRDSRVYSTGTTGTGTMLFLVLEESKLTV